MFSSILSIDKKYRIKILRERKALKKIKEKCLNCGGELYIKRT
jgi:hypothetical protein